jgi:two-component system cell cycle sensor histidine kinase/response regulator CckA
MTLKRILALLVGENPSDALLFRKLLAESPGVTLSLECAQSVEAGLQRIATGGIDVVLLDLGSPVAAGLKALRRLSAGSPETPPVIALSDLADIELALQAARAGAQDYLLKGQVDSASLCRSIRFAIERKHTLKQLLSHSERENTNDALWGSSQMLQLVLDHMPAFVFWKDRNSVYLGCNYLFAENAGLVSPEAIVGLTDLDLPWRDTEAENYRADDRRVMESGIPKLNYEETQTTADGRLTAVRTSKIPLRDSEGRVIGVLGTFEDITERIRAEAALRESEAKYRRIVDMATEGICVVGPDERITFVNERMERMLGYGTSEMLGRVLGDFVFEDDVPDHRMRIENRHRGISETYERCFRRKDGQKLWALGSATPIYDDKHEFIGSFAMFTDITDRKLAAEEQSKLRHHLQQAQKMEAVGQLAGGIAHDFNNILGVINGYSEFLLHEPQLDGATRRSIEEILAAGERAASLTRQLLAFSRKLVLKPKALNLNFVIEGVEKLLRRLLGDDIEIKTALARDLHTVLADPTQMEQVLLNFCINARDAMPEGGSITIETANVEVDEATAAQHFPMVPGSYVRLAVSDTGTGMDKETLSHIFEPFFTTKEPDRGSGLGLATVYGIVNQSGGHVWAHSEPGRGTTFFTYLPASNAELEKQDRERVAQEVPRGTETILLVEDLNPLRDLFRNVLERSGYTVLEAEDSERALQIADTFNDDIALLLTDISLPKARGSTLAKVLQAHRPGIKVLFVSGFTDALIAPNGVFQSGTDFLQKPFPPETLIRKVRDLLDEPHQTKRTRASG